MVRVKLLCGDRPFQMENASMAEAILAAAKRLGCTIENVALKFEEDGMFWEIEGENTYNSAIADGWIIHAFDSKKRRPAKRRRGSNDSNHSNASSTSSHRKSTQNSGHRRPTSESSQPPSTLPNPPRSPSRPSVQQSTHSAIASSSRITPASTQDGMRSSGRIWSEKDRNFLWTKLLEELEKQPYEKTTYTIDERREIFNSILLKYSHRFAGRTAVALEKLIQSRVLEKRRAKRKLPSAVENLFSRTRGLSTYSSASNPSSSNASRDEVSEKHRKRLKELRRTTNGPFSPNSLPQQSLRRNYRGNVIRVEALEPPGSVRDAGRGRSTAREAASIANEDLTESESSTDDEENNECHNSEVRKGVSDLMRNKTVGGSSHKGLGLEVHTKSGDPHLNVPSNNLTKEPQGINGDPKPRYPSTNGTISTDSLFASPSVNSVATIVKQETETEVGIAGSSNTPDRPVELPSQDSGPPSFTSAGPSLVKDEKDDKGIIDVSHVPTMPPSSAVALRADDVRAQMCAALDSILPDLSPRTRFDAWADFVQKKLLAQCFTSNTGEDKRFQSEESAYCLFAALDEFHRYSFLRSQAVQERRIFIVSLAMCLEALYVRLYKILGFEQLLCKFFHYILFGYETCTIRFSAQLVACSTLMINLQSYDSILAGIFALPWTTWSNNLRPVEQRQKQDILSSSATEKVFTKMNEFLEALFVAKVAVRQNTESKSLADRHVKLIRFNVKAWHRVFEETNCDSFNSWRFPATMEDVRKGMERWNRQSIEYGSVIADDVPTNRPNCSNRFRTMDTSTFSNMSFNNEKGKSQSSLYSFPVRNEQQTQSSTNYPESSQQQPQLFLGLPDFSQSVPDSRP